MTVGNLELKLSLPVTPEFTTKHGSGGTPLHVIDAERIRVTDAGEWTGLEVCHLSVESW